MSSLQVRLWAQLRVAYHGVDARFRPTEAIQDHAEVVPHPEEEDIVVNRPTHHLARIEKHALRRHPRKLTIPGFQGRWNEWLSYSRDLDRFCLQKSIKSLV